MNQINSYLLRIRLLKNQGFTLLEVLVGIILITTFTLTALQALVISTVFRVRSAEKSGATAWIQENVEEARFLGATQVDESCRDDDSCGEELETEIESESPNGDESVTWEVNTFNSIEDETRRFLGNDSGRRVWLLRYTNDEDNTLELRYIAVLDDNGSPADPDNANKIVAEVNTEVVPDVAFDD